MNSGKKRTPKFSERWLSKYGLRVASRGGSGSGGAHEVAALSCRFCEVFGRTGRVDGDDGARKRKRTTRVMVFTPPWRTEHMRTHMMEQHGVQYAQFSALGLADKATFFTGSAPAPAPSVVSARVAPAVIAAETSAVQVLVPRADSPGPVADGELAVRALPASAEPVGLGLEGITASLLPREPLPPELPADGALLSEPGTLLAGSTASGAASPAASTVASASSVAGVTAEATEQQQQLYAGVEAYYSRVRRSQAQRATRVAHRLVSEQLAASGAPPAGITELLEQLPLPVRDSFSSCGFPTPLGIRGLHVLVLGCGSGRDAYLASQLVGVAGSVTAVEHAEEQLHVAREHIGAYGSQLGVAYPNVRFVTAYSECLESAGIPARSVDLVLANGVLSLSPFKEEVLAQAHRALRVGGELRLCDVFASRRLRDPARTHELLRGEWLGGALYVEDFKRLCRVAGLGEPRQLCAVSIDTSGSEQVSALVGAARFRGITFRCFKAANSESGPREEDYGEVATYTGSIPEHPVAYALDDAHTFEKGRPVRVGGTTAAILRESWLCRHFSVVGDRSEHFGPFDERLACGRRPAADAELWQ